MNTLRRNWTVPVVLAAGMGMTLLILNAGRALAGDDGGDMPTASLFKPATDGRSYNWAGYVVKTSFNEPANGAISEVSGEWRVPVVSCGDEDSDQFSSVWVGIDGHGSETVQQIGTRQDCSGERPAYGAFLQIYPSPMVPLSAAELRVGPGERVRGSVRYTGSDTFELTLENLSTGQGFRATRTANAARTSAEWVVERPAAASRPGTLLPLARFADVGFDNASVKVNGNTGDLDDSRWKARKIAIVDAENRPLASPTVLNKEGDSFEVRWSKRTQ